MHRRKEGLTGSRCQSIQNNLIPRKMWSLGCAWKGAGGGTAVWFEALWCIAKQIEVVVWCVQSQLCWAGCCDSHHCHPLSCTPGGCVPCRPCTAAPTSQCSPLQLGNFPPMWRWTLPPMHFFSSTECSPPISDGCTPCTRFGCLFLCWPLYCSWSFNIQNSSWRGKRSNHSCWYTFPEWPAKVMNSGFWHVLPSNINSKNYCRWQQIR